LRRSLESVCALRTRPRKRPVKMTYTFEIFQVSRKKVPHYAYGYFALAQKSRARTCARHRSLARDKEVHECALCVYIALVIRVFRFNIQRSGFSDLEMRPRDLEKTPSKETWRQGKGTYKERY